MNNSGAICNVNSTYLGHPCLYDKSSKYAFQQSEQKLLHRHFKGHLSVIWKSCQSLSRNSAGEMAQKIIFTLSLSLFLHLSLSAAFAVEWQAIYTGKWTVFKPRGEKKRRVILFRRRHPPPAHSCIKYAIINVIWTTPNVIMGDTASTRQATEL